MTQGTLEIERTVEMSEDGQVPRRVLMLCYHYPPRQNGGVERSRQFARLLPAQGWDPFVLTLGRPGEAKVDADGKVFRSAQWNFGALKSLLRRSTRSAAPTDAAKRAKVKPRTLGRDVIEHLYFPDPEITWALPALRVAKRIVAREGIDLIYSTSPPESSHVLGYFLKRATGLPWVMDLRDPWSFECLKKPVRTFAPRRWLERAVEHRCFERADRVVLNTPEAAEGYRERLPRLAEKFRVLPNGVDLQELEKVRSTTDEASRWSGRGDDGVLIVHAGTFSRLGWRDTTMRPVLEAFRRLVDEGAPGAANARFVFAGEVAAGIRRSVRELGLEEWFEMTGTLCREDTLRLLDAADRLLLYDPPDDGRSYVRGKLYEYLAVGKPVVGIVPDGASRRLLIDSGQELIAAPDDGSAIESVLRKAVSAEELAAGELDGSRFDRARLANDLARVFDELLETSSRAALHPAARCLE